MTQEKNLTKENNGAMVWLDKGKDLIISVSGIRGTIPMGLDINNIIYFIKAFAKITGKKILIACDSRPNGIFLYHLTVGTLLSEGKDIIDTGIIPTPTLKSAVVNLKADGGIMISASHNPLIWNGFKFIDREGLFFDKVKQSKWYSALNKINFEASNNIIHSNNNSNYSKLGLLKKIDVLDYHIDEVLKYLEEDVKIIRKMKYKVVVDAVAGAGYQAIPKLLEKLDCKQVLLNCELIANMEKFPRDPEPNQASLKALANFVKKEKAAIGFGLDPDSDRLVLASPKRGVINEEYTLPLALLGFEPILKKYQKKSNSNSIVLNLSTSNLCDSLASIYDVKVYRTKVGEANVLEEMIKRKAIFGGEGNGGVIISDISSRGRDPLVGIVLILAAMARIKANSIDEIMQSLPPLYMVKNKFPISIKDFEEISERFLLEFPSSKTDLTDGLHLTQPDFSWIHLRPSNTEPFLRLIIQAPNSKRLSEILKISKQILSKFS